jgi:predicted RND superfamily exporter protein
MADFSTRRARPILMLAAVTTAGFAYLLLQVATDTDLDGFIRPEAQELSDTIEGDFDEGGVLTLIFESASDRSLLEPDLLHRQLKILQELKARYEITTYSLVEGIDEGLKRVKRKSLLDYDDYSHIAEAILALAGGRTVRDLEKVSRHFISHPEAIAFYAKFRIAAAMGAGGQGSGARETTYSIPFVKAIKALVRLDSSYTSTEQRQILAEMRDLSRSLGAPELNVYAINDQLMAYELDQRSKENALYMALTILFVDGLCIWALFRSKRELWVVLTILATSAIWTFGAGALLGIRFSFFHVVALPILLGTGVDDTLVFGRRLAEERAKGASFNQAIRATFVGVGNAICLTTFTTLIAFLITGLTATTEIVTSFFLFVALSMVIVFLLSTFLQGAIRAELARRDDALPHAHATMPHSVLEDASRAMADASYRLAKRRRLVLLLSALLMLVALAWIPGLRSEMRREDMARPGMQTHTANELLDGYFGDSRVGYVLLEGEVENPALLDKIGRLEERLANEPAIEQVLRKANVESIMDLIDKLRITIGSETSVRSVFDQIASNERTADYVLDMSYREAFEHVVRKNGDRYDGLLMRFYTRGAHTTDVLAAYHAIERELEELGFNEIPGIKIRIGGGDVTYSIEAAYYIDLLIKSFLFSLLANLIVLMVIWRRVRPALIAMIPVLFAVALIVGLMAAFGIRLNIFNVAVGAIAVGLGIDYPIHIIERFEEERRNGIRPAERAARLSLQTMGPHILASTLTTVVGFGAASVLALPMAVSFGLLTGAAIAIVYLASMFLLPVLLIQWSGPPARSRDGEPHAVGPHIPC